VTGGKILSTRKSNDGGGEEKGGDVGTKIFKRMQVFWIGLLLDKRGGRDVGAME